VCPSGRDDDVRTYVRTSSYDDDDDVRYVGRSVVVVTTYGR